MFDKWKCFQTIDIISTKNCQWSVRQGLLVADVTTTVPWLFHLNLDRGKLQLQGILNEYNQLDSGFSNGC